jgi:serine/threonine-protein kinase
VDTPPTASIPARKPGKHQRERAKLLIGRVVSDRYRIEDLIALGGMGAVYRAYHRYLKKSVALKVLQSDLEELPTLVARFEREAIAGAHVDHPNVAAATDFGKLDDGSFFLVVEYVRGITLADVVRRGPLAPARAVRLGCQLASALAAVHRAGIVHRDVKSRNVMLVEGADDCAKLIDFGLARVQLDRLSAPVPQPRARLESVPQRITGVGEVFGTVAYLAPEAILGMDAVDARSDLYALGVILYEMLTGCRPFVETELVALFHAQQTEPPPRFASRAPEVVVPAALEAVVLRLLARDPAARYQTGEEVVEALDEAFAPARAALPALAAPDSSSLPRSPLVEDPAASALPLRRAPYVEVAALFGLGFAIVLAVVLRSAAPPPARLVLASAIASAALHGAESPEPAAALPAVAPGAVTADTSASRLLFLRAARARDHRSAARALTALAERDPRSFRDPEIAAAARDVAASLGVDAAADEVFETLARRLGGAGVDVLYAIVERKGGTLGAARATELLRRGDVMDRASPAVRLAFTLRDAPCEAKPDLFDAAEREGDARALAVLETQGRACFQKNRALEQAIAALRVRLLRR